ncbi:MAG: hypothetical protein B7Y55_08750 [Polynucleobacter sp. 35-46-207]|nr:MAG: hypothetical protein B7Y55_08750 [Polynucleobacter sp. 35-46-207]OZB41637.1 MAG: hypothetical protein B7X60_11295 [Polynucleobacter sp. 39-45-136]
MKAPKNYCCGSGVCIINEDGECWCGQVWDGEKMAPAILKPLTPSSMIDNADKQDSKPQS